MSFSILYAGKNKHILNMLYKNVILIHAGMMQIWENCQFESILNLWVIYWGQWPILGLTFAHYAHKFQLQFIWIVWEGSVKSDVRGECEMCWWLQTLCERGVWNRMEIAVYPIYFNCLFTSFILILTTLILNCNGLLKAVTHFTCTHDHMRKISWVLIVSSKVIITR